MAGIYIDFCGAFDAGTGLRKTVNEFFTRICSGITCSEGLGERCFFRTSHIIIYMSVNISSGT